MLSLAAECVFTGTELLERATVHIRGGLIADVTPGVAANASLLEGILAPGLIDAQVNGGGGVLFNDAPTLETLRTITAAHGQLGVTSLMATLITDERGKIGRAIAAMDQAIAEEVQGLLGLHLEGPWLSAPKRGVHPQGFLRALDAGDLRDLTAKRAWPVMVTVAPEQASPEDVRALVAAGVVVSIGHTAAAHDQVEALVKAGATGFTHLFNAMPPLEGRKPGAVGVALTDTSTWAGLILDGIHVHPMSARVALAAKTASRLFLVSDAMATVGSHDSGMKLFGEQITVSEGALRTADGTLAGAHLDMASAARNAVAMLGASTADALRMATLTPAEFLGVAGQRGRIGIGARADMVLLSSQLDVRNVWVAGKLVS